ncbi:Transcription factor [Fusarium albosuccineum]|uniref:Transcription factor n=1 Tax=Fusarium albosuccineum TaxID=1237068 RepID=A0A8H4P246_9HYPO|nr:Transcription factor [Fusarium albosuccineum]
MAPDISTARARASCSRCHKRKKRCDRALPSCKNCLSARVGCSFEYDERQSASYPIAYVRSLEERLQQLEQKLAANERATPSAEEATVLIGNDNPYGDFNMGDTILVDQENSTPQAVYGSDIAPAADNPEPPIQQPQHNPQTVSAQSSSSFVQELTALSLEATAERYLGSTSGLSFAKLTQTVLRRLTPDKADFVFVNHQDDTTGATMLNFNSPSELFNDTFFQSLSESVSVHPLLFGDLFLADITESDSTLESLAWPTDEAHVQRLVDFYFAHSHTLYPILKRSQVMDTLEKVRGNPQNLTTQSPLDMFRIWMVLAIGSTAYSSVSVTEESESMVYYNKALQYSEQALGSDEMMRSALEVIMLQVSYSFFNQLGPNTWFLVGTAARLALGMGLHTSSTYEKLPVDVQQRRKRIFFSIYMMDRCSLQPSVMAVPLHILKLRRIASKISRQIYGNVKNKSITDEDRDKLISSLHQELLEWRRNMPFPLPDVNDGVPHLNTTWYDFNYYTHLAMIYRPSPLCPVLDSKRIKTLEMAASMSLRQAFSMHQQRRFAYNWLNFLSLFTSTLSLVYAITAQPNDLTTVLRETRAIGDLNLAMQLFDTLGLKFFAAKKIRTMIAEISRRYKEMCAPKGTEGNVAY